jgi:Domain of unknown function (DUF4868)
MRRGSAKRGKKIVAAAAALEKLRASLTKAPANAGCHVFLKAARGRTNADKWRRLQFTVGLATRFRAQLVERLLDQLPAADDLVMFSHGEMTGSQVAVLEKSDIAEIATWMDEVPAPDWLHVFEGDEAFFRKVRFHVTRLDVASAGEHLKIFRQRSSTSLLHRRSFMAIFNVTQYQFSEVDGRVFDFALDGDFIEWEGLIFILRLSAFESLTNVREITIREAHRALEDVRAVEGLGISGFDAVAASLEARPQLAKKLAAAKRQGTVDNLHAKALADRIKQKGLPLAVVKRKNGHVEITINPDDADQIKEFVNLVTDVYLRSPVTEMEYAVSAKTPVPS